MVHFRLRSPVFALIVTLLVGLELGGLAAVSSVAAVPAGNGKIQHVVVIMQENRSFDSYFGTFPGADGLPRQNGQFGVCVPDPRGDRCVQPQHDPSDMNGGGPHGTAHALADINGGKMDGFIDQAEKAPRGCLPGSNDPNCGPNSAPDVMGYHDAREIPNYWDYARNFVLQDRMFQPDLSWSLPSHLFMVSEWSARCSAAGDPATCKNALAGADLPPDFGPAPHKPPKYAWTDLTYLMHKYGVSWKYFVADGTEPDCVHDEVTCPPVHQSAGTPGLWNPLPWFTTVHQNGQLGNVQPLTNFYSDARAGRLPQVSWITPNQQNSEHPPALVSSGQAYVTGLVNAVMKSPNWDSTAIFISWDDWGGFYDHVVPPRVDSNGYGLRIPGLVISPYAKRDFIDHQTLSFDAYDKFIEDVFMGGARIDPRTDGRPDPRPGVRENQPGLGDLLNDFDFTQAPRTPVVLSTKLGGILTSAPAVAASAGGRLDVFGRGIDNSLWHRWWWSGSWSAWERLGGSLTSQPAVVASGPDHLDVFVRGSDGALWLKSWAAGAWSSWESLGGTLSSGPTVASRTPNRLDVFVRGIDDALWQRSWDGGGWGGWEFRGGTLASSPAATSWGPDRIDVFSQDSQGGLQHRWLENGVWSSWEHTAGSLTSEPAVSSRGRGRLDVFARWSDNALWRKSWNGTAWSGWTSLGGQWVTGPAAASESGSDVVHAFDVGSDRTLQYMTYS